jgi:hypothetical protein
VSLRPLSQGIITDEHVLAVVVVSVTDDGGTGGGASALQVKQLIGVLDAPEPVGTSTWDRHGNMSCEV